MPVREDFNTETSQMPSNYAFTPINDQVLQTYSTRPNGSVVNQVTYDFLNRVVMVAPSSGDSRTFTFNEFDEGAIEWHYNKMVAAGRKPRPPASLETKPGAPRARNGLGGTTLG